MTNSQGTFKKGRKKNKKASFLRNVIETKKNSVKKLRPY